MKVKGCSPVAQMHITNIRTINEFTQNLSEDWEMFSATSFP
jgi:hypothetical protein